MRTSIATVSLSGSLAEKLEAAARAGFDAVEIFEQDLVVSDLSPADVRRRAEDLGLGIDLYQPFRDLEGTDRTTFARALDRAARKFEIAYQLGAPTVLVCSNVATATIDDDGLAAEQLYTAGELAADVGVRIAYEALAWGTYVNDYRRAWRIAAAAAHPAVGTCLDSFHILSLGTSLAEIGSLPADRIFFVQLADAPSLQLDVLSWSRHYRLFPGQGAWDLTDFVDRIVRTGYDGPLSIEVFNDVFRQTDPERTARDALRSLRALEDGVAHGLHEKGRRARMPLAELPTGGPARAIDFVELAAADTAELGDVFDALGFEGRGAHRRKDAVELWSSGDARLIVNHRADHVGGPRLAAIGIQVDDGASAAARAAALLAPRVERSTLPDEAELFGSTAPDATEIYWSSTPASGVPSWEGEFSAPDGQHRGLAIDHVSLSHPWEFYDEAVLYYRSVLGLEPESSADVADPHGLVRSQVMENADRSVRLVLNVLPPLADEPTSGHLALRCDDIMATVDRLIERRVPLLRLPDNYYDDLRARFQLDEDDITPLRDRNLLYDRDGDGEFWQAYLLPTGRFFVELVQRRGGYDGYGAANAPVRRTAQSRATAAAL